MTAATEIRTHAQLFGWESHTDPVHGDTFIRGENMVAVNYTRAGTVDRAYRYLFFRADDLKLQESAPARSKKSAVVAWLASLGA